MPKRTNRPLDPIPEHVAVPELDPSDWHYTYFAENPATGLIKIGSTYCPRLMTRMRELEREYGIAMNLRAVVAGGEAVERSYHARFAAIRDHREWFRPSPELSEVIRLANATGWTPDGTAYWGEWPDLLTAPASGAPAAQQQQAGGRGR